MLRLVLTGATFGETLSREVSNNVVPNRAYVKVAAATAARQLTLSSAAHAWRLPW